MPGDKSPLGADYFLLEVGTSLFKIKQASVFSNQLLAFPTSLSVFFSGIPTDIHWDFGDGSTADETGVTATSQTHTYTSIGTFDLKVNISNIKSFKFNQTQVCVEERITGFGISLPSSYVEVGVASPLRLEMASGSDYTCTLTFNDGKTDTIRTTDDIATPPNTDYMYTFPKAGHYTVTAVCANGIGTVTDTLTTTAVERIVGLALNPPGAMAGVNFRITVIWTSGTDVTLILNYDGAPITMTVNEQTRTAVSGIMAGTVTGKHPVSVVMSNSINTETLDMDFSIEIAITKPSVTCNFLSEITTNLPAPNVVIPTNSGVECHVTMEDGTSVHLIITWGDGSSSYTHSVADGDPWSSNPAPDPITHSFTAPDICSMSVVLENGFSSYTFTYIVNVMTSVDNVEINPVSPVEFTPPASVTFAFR